MEQEKERICARSAILPSPTAMWCPNCRLDVPALAVPEEPGIVRCAYCRQEMSGRAECTAEEAPQLAAFAPVDEPRAETAPARPALAPPPLADDWKVDADLRAVERMVAVLRQSHGGCGGVRDATAGASAALSPSHLPIALASETAAHPAAMTPTGGTDSEKGGLAAWSCLSLGLMAFVCGGVLLIWSFAAGRSDLWSIGLPLTLAGQAGLVLGLVLQLDGLWQSNKRTEQTLTDLDGQLGQLRTAASLLGASHSGPAHSFYAHLVEGAGPQLLLADLKGQLDLLAQQMARQRRAA